MKQPDSVSMDEEQGTIGSGLRRRDKITRQETSGVYWVNTKTIDVRREGSRNGAFSLKQQLDEVDRFLDMVKRKKRAWKFENVDWAYHAVEWRKISLMKRRGYCGECEIGEDMIRIKRWVLQFWYPDKIVVKQKKAFNSTFDRR